MQVHPSKTAAQLGIPPTLLSEVSDSDHATDFWQVTAPRAIALREVALRLFACVAAALGVERLWSACRLALSDRRRSLNSGRLMLPVYCKMNMHTGHLSEPGSAKSGT